MEQQELVRQLIEACDSGGHAEAWPPEAAEINLSLIEALKKEVDSCLRTDARLALRRAELTHRLSEGSADPLARALGLRAKAQALHLLGRYQEALDHYERAGEIYRGEERPVEAARISRSMVDALMYLSRYDEALALAREARQTFVDHDEVLLAAQLDTNVGNLHHRLDQYQLALDCYRRAGEVFAERGDLTAQAVTAFNSANILSNLDDFHQAERLYRQALDLYQSQQMRLAAAQVEYSLGYLHFLRGEYQPAIHDLHKVRDEWSELKDGRMIALCDLDLSEIYLQLHVHEEAAKLASRARDLLLELRMRYEAAKALMFLGLARLQQARLDESEECLREARAEFIEEGNHVYQGLIGLYLAEIFLLRESPEEALELATDAGNLFAHLELRTKSCYVQLVAARAWLLKDRPDSARQLCESILAATAEQAVPWLKYQVHNLLGDIAIAAQDLTAARSHFEDSVACIEQIRTGIRVDEFRSAFFKDKLEVYEKLINLCLARQEDEDFARAFFYLESRKARTLVDFLINDLDVTPAEHDESQVALMQKWKQLREELLWFYNKANLHDAGDKSRALAMNRQVQQEIDRRERALSELAREAQIRAPHSSLLRSVAGITVDDVRDALAADEIVIEYYFDAESLKIFVIGREGMHVIGSPYSPAELRSMILEWRFQLDKLQYGPSFVERHQEALEAGAVACLKEMYQALFAPLAWLAEGKKLIFIPFESLHNVPFQALHDGEAYLIERHEIAYAPSSSLFLLMSGRRPPVAHDGPQVLIFGAADEMAPQIAEEIQAIRKMFPDAHCFTGHAASPQALSEHLPASDIVHIACHAVFRQDNPMFSAFKLSGEWLNFYDVCSLRSRNALIVLSGCSTGLTGIYAGDEILGLVRGFLHAGASSLVVSLWAVNDRTTAELMTAFYQRMSQGESPRTALRQSSLSLMPRYAHPYYWAPFVLIGANERL